MFNLKKKNLKDLDLLLLFSTLALCVYGLIVLYSAYGGDFSAIRTQIGSTIIGYLVIALLCTMDLDAIKKSMWFIYGLSILLLIITLIFGRGLDEWGAKSWVYLGSFSIQPSEIVKILLIFSFASYLDRYKLSLNEVKRLILTLAFVGIPVGLILLQPDFGTAMVYVFFIAAMLFVAGISWKWIIILLLAGLTVGFRNDSYRIWNVKWKGLYERYSIPIRIYTRKRN